MTNKQTGAPLSKILFLVRGLPWLGAGKTTLAELLASKMNAPVISADDYFMVGGEYKFDASKLGAAHLTCQSRVLGEMAQGQPFIFVANTFTTAKEMKPYFDMAEKWDYDTFSIIVENRHGHISIHNVPTASIDAMRDRFVINL